MAACESLRHPWLSGAVEGQGEPLIKSGLYGRSREEKLRHGMDAKIAGGASQPVLRSQHSEGPKAAACLAGLFWTVEETMYGIFDRLEAQADRASKHSYD